MSAFIIITLILAFLSIFFLFKGFSTIQVRDKRFKKGVKKKFNWISILFFALAFICLYSAYRFYYYS